MARPNAPRTIGAESRLRGQVSNWLDQNERSVSWLAKKMTEAGCPIGSASLWKSLAQDRKILVDEALAISTVTGLSLTDLIGS